MSVSTLSLLDQSIYYTALKSAEVKRIDEFISAHNFEESLRSFLKFADIKEKISGEELVRIVNVLVARIDQKINRQVNAILHHPKLQQLEASWRGLNYLVYMADEEENIRIRFLDVNWVTLVKDLDRAIEFDQSALFRKVYNNEFGMAGGEPFGVLLGDYTITHRPSQEHRTDDLVALREISQISAAAFAPFIASADPKIFGVDDFAGLGLPVNYEAVFSQAEYLKWNSFRQTEDSRFVGLTLPQVLMREPYEYDTFRSDRFVFKEDVSSPNGKDYLWGNAVYAFGAVLMQSFASNAWFTNIRGSHAGVGAGGIVSQLPVPSFKTDSKGIALKFATDVLITDLTEKALSELGFIPLCHSKDTEYAVFYSNQSVQGEKSYADESSKINARISGMLQYIMCVSRFAHYVKVIGRDKIGSFFSAQECEDYLYKWLLSYSTASTTGTEEHLAKYPLSEAKVEVKEVIGKPGVYKCTIHLKPHMQLDEMVSAVKLVTELSEVKT